MDPLFPPIPDDLAALSDDELSALADGIVATRERLARFRAGEQTDEDVAWLGERDIDVAQVVAAADAMDAIRSVQSDRAEAADAATADLDAALGRMTAEQTPAPDPAEPNPNDPAPADDDHTDEDGNAPEAPAPESEPVQDADREPVMAAGRRVIPAGRFARDPRREVAPVEDDSTITITASGDVPGHALGQRLMTREDIANAMIAKRQDIGIVHDTRSAAQKVGVVSIRAEYPAERQLHGDHDDYGVMRAAVEQHARDRGVATDVLTAAGGICAPAVTVYDFNALPHLQDRPVRNALPNFGAVRGGVSFPVTGTLGAVPNGAFGHITAAQDATGGTPAAKACVTFPCPTWVETDIDILYRCIQWGNLPTRTLPEMVDYYMGLTLAFWARAADTFLLDRMYALSAKVTTDAALGVTATNLVGALPNYLVRLTRLAAGIRSTHRLDPAYRFQAVIPQWFPEMLAADADLRYDSNMEAVRADMVRILGTAGIDATFTRDSRTGGAGILSAPADGAAVAEWPDTVETYLYPAGTFVYLDGGTLDLGMVRDSALNSINSYQVFYESFENIAKVGPIAYHVTSTLNVTGGSGGGFPVADQ